MMRRILTLCVASVAVLLLASTAHAAVMGIDFGSEFIKVASVKPGTPFHIVVDEQAKRKIPAVVGFDGGERQFGNGALALAIKKPKETYLWAQRLLGKDINAPQVAELRAMGYPWDIVELPDRRSLGFRHAAGKDGEPDVVFSVEEVVAMSLQHVMKIAEADAERPVTDCVITVPSYWTHRERAAMLDAAEIAGLNVLSLVNENTAAAIQYGIDRKPVEGEDTHIMFYNMGSSTTQVDIATFSAYVRKERGKAGNRTVGQFEMRGMGFDDTLGGMAFEARATELIVQYVQKQLAESKRDIDITKNLKAMAKIRAAAEKAKIVLSANQETQVFIGSLVEDTDFKFMMTRAEFYERSTDLLDRVHLPIEQALQHAGMTMDQIDSLVIIGGSVRIPGVQAKIKEFTGLQTLAQNLNGDEAMVMGAVFRAANQSTTFKVRPLGMIDTAPYAVGVRITSGVKEEAAVEGEAPVPAFSKRASLFKRHNRMQKKKVVQFTHDADFQCLLSHEQTKSNVLPAGIAYPISLYNVTGLDRMARSDKYAALLAEQKPKVSLSFMLDASGLSLLTRAEATLEESIKVPVPKKEPKKDEDKEDADAEEGEKKEGEAEEEKKEADPAADIPEEESDEPEFTIKKKTHSVPLSISLVGSPGSIDRMNATHKLLAKAALEKLRRADDLKKEIAASKNSLEAYIYATRSAVRESDVEPVSTEEQREAVIEALSEAEDWLYDQADDSAEIFKDKLKELRKLSEPIFFRLAEQTALPTALNVTHSLIAFVRKQVADYEANRPWVPESDLEKLTKLVDALDEFVTEKQAAQAAQSPTEAPLLESEQLYERLRPIHKLSEQMAKLRKPIEKPKKVKKPKKGKANKTEEEAAAHEDAKEAGKDEDNATKQEQSQEDNAEQKEQKDNTAEGEAAKNAAADDAAEEVDGEKDEDDDDPPKDEL